MKASGYVMVTLKFRKEGKRWAAFCEELGTASFGRSIQEALKNIKEAVLLHLNTLEDVGEIERFFREHNITFHSHKPKRDEIKISGPIDTETFIYPYIHPIYEELTGV